MTHFENWVHNIALPSIEPVGLILSSLLCVATLILILREIVTQNKAELIKLENGL